MGLVSAGRGAFLRVLFVTTEMDDFVRVGGLAAVSAALPRALRSWSDVRIILPGYRDVVEQFLHIEIVGQCAPLADMPACSLGLTAAKDGLPVYVLLCPQLYDRPGNPYGDASGRDWPDNDVRFGRFDSAAAQLAAGRSRCAGSAHRRTPSISTASNSTTSYRSSKAASSTLPISPPSARPTPRRSRPPNSAAD